LGKGLGDDGRTLKRMHDDGYTAVFVGIGLSEPKKIPAFKGLKQEHGFYTSKDFLPLVARASKPGMNCAIKTKIRPNFICQVNSALSQLRKKF